jgi:hypothetical protein
MSVTVDPVDRRYSVDVKDGVALFRLQGVPVLSMTIATTTRLYHDLMQQHRTQTQVAEKPKRSVPDDLMAMEATI